MASSGCDIAGVVGPGVRLPISDKRPSSLPHLHHLSGHHRQHPLRQVQAHQGQLQRSLLHIPPNVGQGAPVDLLDLLFTTPTSDLLQGNIW